MNLIFFDLDGTLLNSESEISLFTKETLAKLGKNEIAYSAATGRTMLTGASILKGHGFDIVSGGTDNHLVLVDLRPKGLTGRVAEIALERASITCNKNGVPFDPEKPMITSGIRLGTPAATTRGFGVNEFQKIGDLIAEVLDAVAQSGAEEAPEAEAKVRAEVTELCGNFPIY